MADGSRVTIHDVARAANVSSQTVSNVLHGRGRVADSTRQRVLQVIQRMGYRPHVGAASLRTHRSERIAHPIQPGELDPSNTIMLEFIRALTAAAGRRNHNLLLVDSAGDIDKLVRSGAVDAVVLADIVVDDPRVVTLQRLGVPFACFGRIEPERSRNWIDIDSWASVRDLTTRLIDAGHERLAFVGYATGSRWDIEREAGFRDAVAAAGLVERVHKPALDPTAVHETIEALLDDEPRPTAIVTGSDVLAGGVYAAASRRRIRIGDELAVTGFDGGMTARLLSPSLTTLTIPLEHIGDWLVDRALAEIDGATDLPGELISAELVIGESAHLDESP